MTGVILEFDHQQALAAMRAQAAALDDPAPLLRDIGEYLLSATEDRFRAQRAPDGTPWQSLTPRYARRKRRNADKVLTLRGYLRGTLRYQIEAATLLLGSDRVYAAIQHFGGATQHEARAAELYFRRVRDGAVGHRLVKKRNSNFAQRVHIGAYTVRLPARPWLGVAASDANVILEITRRHLRNAANRRAV